MPPLMLLEDAEDLCDFLEVTRRTVQAATWATEVIEAVRAEQVEGMF